MTKQAGETSGPGAAADRQLLTSVAYRLLGSMADAEDAVQEGYARWFAQSPQARQAITSPAGWRVRTVSRICLDMLGSARSRRETYVGQWLPEPVPDGPRWTSQADSGATDPSEQITFDETVSMAVLVVLDSMTPAERVAFVLHDAFAQTFAEIGAVLDRSAAACRQLAASGRRRVRAAQIPRSGGDEHREVVAAFKRAWEAGDLDGLVAVLDPDAVAVADGGGLVRAGLKPVRGARPVARLLLALRGGEPPLELHETAVNGEAGLVATGDGSVHTVIAIGAAGSRVARIWAVRNPHKLRLWAPPAGQA